jgi:two-component system NarL family sensor kinase
MAMTSRSAERLAWGLAVLAGAILVPSIVFLVLSWAEPIPPGAFGFKGFSLFFALMLMVVGVLIATRRPANPIGWLCLGGAIGSAIQEFTFDYALYAQSQGMTQAGRYAAWVNSWIWIVSLTALTAMTLLFPEGRLRSPRWRWALWRIR